MSKVRNERGIALLQVLLISVIFSIVFLSLSASLNNKIQIARDLQDHAVASTKLNTLESRAYFELLSKAWADTELAKHPNTRIDFFSHHVATQEGTTEVAGMGAFVSVYNVAACRKLLLNAGFPESSIEQLMIRWKMLLQLDGFRSLLSVHSSEIGNRRHPLQLEEELTFLSPDNAEIIKSVLPLLTLYPVKSLYPFGMSKAVLSLYLEPDVADEIVQKRRTGAMPPAVVNRYFTTDEYTTLSVEPGPGVMLNFTAISNDVRLQRRVIITLLPYGESPLEIWEFRKFY